MFSAQISHCKCGFEGNKIAPRTSYLDLETGWPQFRAEAARPAAPDELWANLVARSYHQIGAETGSLLVKIVSNAISA